MITPKAAYDIVKKKYDNIGIVEEFHDCYVIVDNDLDIDHGVNKETGEMFDVWLTDLVKLMEPYDPDAGIEPKTYKF